MLSGEDELASCCVLEEELEVFDAELEEEDAELPCPSLVLEELLVEPLLVLLSPDALELLTSEPEVSSPLSPPEGLGDSSSFDDSGVGVV